MISTTTRKNTFSINAYSPMEINFGTWLKPLSDEEFYDFCRQHRDFRIERDRNGDIHIMPPTFSETGGRNFTLAVKFGMWAETDGTGKGFDSSTGFTLPNGAIRSPDLSWIKLSRWEKIPKTKRKKFVKICPDFVIELRSESDSLKKLQTKMQEYVENGASLGWLIDAIEKKVHIYRPNIEVEILKNPSAISGEPLLKNFTLNLFDIWE